MAAHSIWFFCRVMSAQDCLFSSRCQSPRAKITLRIRFETRRPAALSSQPELTSRAFDQNRINREEARCCCSAGFGFSPNTFTALQYNTQQDFMYHTEQRALLIHWVINHSGPAPSLFISLAIYQIQRFNSFTNLLLLIQVGRGNWMSSPTRKV